MKRTLIALLAAGLSLALAHADDSKNEATIAATYLQIQDTDSKTANLDGDLLFGLSPRIHLGPAVSVAYSKVGSFSSTGAAVGLGLEFDLLTETIRPFVGIQGLYWLGELSNTIQSQASARAGLKLGGGTAFLKAYYERTSQYEASGAFNAQQDFNQVVIGLGLRF